MLLRNVDPKNRPLIEFHDSVLDSKEAVPHSTTMTRLAVRYGLLWGAGSQGQCAQMHLVKSWVLEAPRAGRCRVHLRQMLRTLFRHGLPDTHWQNVGGMDCVIEWVRAFG